jgi:hypothetical protein
VREVCQTYQQAPVAAKTGRHTESCDEMTGIQALERAAPTKPVKPGLIERREFEYIRHGTLTLIAGFDVVSGKLNGVQLGPTRTEADFAAYIKARVKTVLFPRSNTGVDCWTVRNPVIFSIICCNILSQLISYHL